MRRPETATLHGPWDDTEPDPDVTAMAALREEHPGWVIWRAVSSERIPGAWCARRTDLSRSPAGLTAHSPDELRRMLTEADR